MAGRIVVYAVATRYAWEVVEAALSRGQTPVCVDNYGGADPSLPGLGQSTDPDEPFVLGLAAALHRAAGAHAAAADGHSNPAALAHPSAVVASTATLAHGAFLNAGTVVGSHTTLGCHTNLNRSVSIGPDNEIGFAASFGPGAVTADSVRVGAAAFVGAGATVLPGLSIGRRATVGAGAVVSRDVGDFEVVVGNPAVVVRPRKPLQPVEDDRCPHCS